MAKKKKGAPIIRQIDFGRIDFGHFDIGQIRGSGRPHFDIAGIGSRPFGSHFDDPWHEDRQFTDRGHGDGHHDQHTDDPDYPDNHHSDLNHTDRHNDQHTDDPDYPDTGNHTDRYHSDQPPSYTDVSHSDGGHGDTPHEDNHDDTPHDDSHDDSDFGGITRKQFQDALGRIQSVINQLIRQQQQTIYVTERHLNDMTRKLNAAFDQVFKGMADLEARVRGSQPPGDDDPHRPPR
jgi:hypothetical protein